MNGREARGRAEREGRYGRRARLTGTEGRSRPDRFVFHSLMRISGHRAVWPLAATRSSSPAVVQSSHTKLSGRKESRFRLYGVSRWSLLVGEGEHLRRSSDGLVDEWVTPVVPQAEAPQLRARCSRVFGDAVRGGPGIETPPIDPRQDISPAVHSPGLGRCT